MTTDPKPLTREELLRLGAAVVNGDEDVLEAFGHAMRHLAALLPAEGLPPIDRDDERTVDALVAAKTGRARRMVTHSCPDCEFHARDADAAVARGERAESALEQVERDLAQEIARAEAAEKRVAELECVTADRDGLQEDEAEYQALRKATDAELRSVLGPRLWGELWGPELEALGNLFDAKNKAIAEKDSAARNAGIREGLERAAMEMAAWSEEHAWRIRAMKEQVK